MGQKIFLLIFAFVLAGTLSGYDVKNKALAPVKFSASPKHADLKLVENGKLNFAIVADLQAEQRMRKNCRASRKVSAGCAGTFARTSATSSRPVRTASSR